MEIEELQRQWQSLDEKLDRTLKMDGELLRLAMTGQARHRLNRFAIWPALDIAFCLAVLLFGGSFLGNHWDHWSLVGPVVVLMIGGLIFLIASIRQFYRISEIDWGGGVGEIQRSLSRIQMAKIRQFKWIILFSPLVGFCGMIVGLQWLLDRLPEPQFIQDKLNPLWVAGNYVFGVLFLPFGHLFVRFLGKWFKGRQWWQSALADISGTSLKKTREELERWASLDPRVSIPKD